MMVAMGIQWLRNSLSILLCAVLSVPMMVISPVWADEDHAVEFDYAGYQRAVGQSSSEALEDKLKETEKEIQELESKLVEVRSTAKTLNQQISYMDNQIRLTQLKIAAHQADIDRLNDEINDLGGKIETLDGQLDQLSEALAKRISQSYKRRQVSIFTLFLGNSFSEFSGRIRYLQAAQQNDQQLMVAMEQTKRNFSSQKELKEDKQILLDQAQTSLKNETAALDQQKSGKQALLTATKSDEKRYQEMLAAARAEQSAIQNAIASVVKQLQDGQPVSAGQQIALMGNSGAAGGCSTGAHLHFEVTDHDGAHQNPANYLRQIDGITWDTAPDGPFSFTGSWDWPMSDVRVTQGYGYTWWANSGFYGGRPHTGIDMVGMSSIVIRTPLAGTLYKGAAQCRGKPMNYVAVKHDNGFITWYWHVQ